MDWITNLTKELATAGLTGWTLILGIALIVAVAFLSSQAPAMLKSVLDHRAAMKRLGDQHVRDLKKLESGLTSKKPPARRQPQPRR